MMKTVFATMIMVLAACGVSIEDAKENAISNAEKAFEEESIETNEQFEEIQYYLPNDFTIKEQTSNNIILEKNSHPFILFYNQYESKNSKDIYEMTTAIGGNIIIDQTFENDNRFGYLIITETEEDLFEVTAGIGGVKVTTESDMKDMAENAGILMEIANSSVIADSTSS